MEFRIGQGFDIHRLVPGRPLVLGGVTVPFELGLDGHSDADVLLHAVIDALLGASSLGNIGELFPNTSVEWKDAPSLHLLKLAWQQVSAAGWRLGNLDAHIHCEAPRLAPFLPAMRQEIATVLQYPEALVSVKVGTCEGLGAVGRGEGIMASAVVLLRK